MQLVAKKEFRYDGIVRRPGDRFEASMRAARIFKGVGKAEDAKPESQEPSLDLETTSPQRSRRAGRYNRRDLRAQD